MYSTGIGFYINFVALIFLACVDDAGLAGDGTTQGTCGTGERCTALGECLGW